MFDGDPKRVWKFWVVARNFPELSQVAFFKPTSNPRYYDEEPSRLSGVVEYQSREFEFFQERTFIDPDARFCIPYAYLRACYVTAEIRPVGDLPEDFRERMNKAAQNKEEWREKNRRDFFYWFK